MHIYQEPFNTPIFNFICTYFFSLCLFSIFIFRYGFVGSFKTNLNPVHFDPTALTDCIEVIHCFFFAFLSSSQRKTNKR